jgi:hypothetical protein
MVSYLDTHGITIAASDRPALGRYFSGLRRLPPCLDQGRVLSLVAGWLGRNQWVAIQAAPGRFQAAENR